MRRERCAQACIALRIDLSARLLRAIDRVAKRLRGFVRQLTRSERLEPNLPFIQRALRGFASASIARL